MKIKSIKIAKQAAWCHIYMDTQPTVCVSECFCHTVFSPDKAPCGFWFVLTATVIFSLCPWLMFAASPNWTGSPECVVSLQTLLSASWLFCVTSSPLFFNLLQFVSGRVFPSFISHLAGLFDILKKAAVIHQSFIESHFGGVVSSRGSHDSSCVRISSRSSFLYVWASFKQV